VVVIDGKKLFGAREAGNKAMVRKVSAWASGDGLLWGQ
jgi:hypothetical protein